MTEMGSRKDAGNAGRKGWVQDSRCKIQDLGRQMSDIKGQRSEKHLDSGSGSGMTGNGSRKDR
jgi:hypothetical protein